MALEVMEALQRRGGRERQRQQQTWSWDWDKLLRSGQHQGAQEDSSAGLLLLLLPLVLPTRIWERGGT